MSNPVVVWIININLITLVLLSMSAIFWLTCPSLMDMVNNNIQQGNLELSRFKDYDLLCGQRWSSAWVFIWAVTVTFGIKQCISTEIHPSIPLPHVLFSVWPRDGWVCENPSRITSSEINSLIILCNVWLKREHLFVCFFSVEQDHHSVF